jgi:hypothetical protein
MKTKTYPLDATVMTLRPEWRLGRLKLAPVIRLRCDKELGILSAVVDDRYTMRVIRELDLMDENYDFGELVLENYATNNRYKYDLHLFIHRTDDRYELSAYIREHRLLQPTRY